MFESHFSLKPTQLVVGCAFVILAIVIDALSGWATAAFIVFHPFSGVFVVAQTPGAKRVPTLSSSVPAFAIAAIIVCCRFILVAAFNGIAHASHFFAGVFMFGAAAAGHRSVAFAGAIGLAFVIQEAFIAVIANLAFVDGVFAGAIHTFALRVTAIAIVFITNNGVGPNASAALARVGLGAGIKVVAGGTVEVGVDTSPIDTLAVVAFTHGTGIVAGHGHAGANAVVALIIDGAGIVVITGAIDLGVSANAGGWITVSGGGVALDIVRGVVTNFVGTRHASAVVALVVKGAQLAIFTATRFGRVTAIAVVWVTIAQRLLALRIGRVVADREATRNAKPTVALIVEGAKITIFTVADDRIVTAIARGGIAIPHRFLTLRIGRVGAGLGVA